MKYQLIAAILASSALASPALARDDSWYVEADGGATMVDDMQLVLDHNSTILQMQTGTQISQLGTKTGYDFGGIVGYDFGMFRLEAEASYRRASADALAANSCIVGAGAAAAASVRLAATSQATNCATGLASATNVSGNVSALSFMVNGLLDFGPDDGLQVYGGGGVGYSHATVRAAGTTGTFSAFNLNGTDNGFAWQLLAGLRYPLSDRVGIGLKYRFFNQKNVNVPMAAAFTGNTVFTLNEDLHTRFRSHSAMLTLGYNFGSPPAPVLVTAPIPVPVPVSVPAPPPPPPPAPAPVCEKGPYIVFFDWDKSDITPEAATILDSAVTAYANCANVPIMLAGYADRSGSTTYNQGLSERRNTAVTAYLTGHGVPGGAVSSQGFGESNNRVPTADGVRELQNRRVEITYGPGSGM